MTNGKRNRSAGHLWEREGVKDFSPFYPLVRTSRQANPTRDALKVDLAYADEHTNGRFPFNAQYKNYSKVLPYYKLLSEMPVEDGIINVVMHKQTEKVGGRFLMKGKYAIMTTDDFFKMVAWRRGYEILRAYFDGESGQWGIPQVITELKSIGL